MNRRTFLTLLAGLPLAGLLPSLRPHRHVLNIESLACDCGVTMKQLVCERQYRPDVWTAIAEVERVHVKRVGLHRILNRGNDRLYVTKNVNV